MKTTALAANDEANVIKAQLLSETPDWWLVKRASEAIAEMAQDELDAAAQGSRYDYDNQAWIVDGVYADCGHPEDMTCHCYGRAHAGETA